MPARNLTGSFKHNPNTLLETIRRLVDLRNGVEGRPTLKATDTLFAIEEAFMELDRWLIEGGHLPNDWAARRAIKDRHPSDWMVGGGEGKRGKTGKGQKGITR